MGLSFWYIVLILMFEIHIGHFKSRTVRDAPWNLIPLTDRHKMEILLHHNDLRRLAGSSNMRYMSWDSELEWMAIQYSKNCNFQHSTNRRHSRGWSVGENIHAQMHDMPVTGIPKAIQKWYDEKMFFNTKNWTCGAGKSCGHYTQIVWAKSFKIGCALATCNRLRNVYWNSRGSLLICNYATRGNNIGNDGKLMSVFKQGPACSQCGEYDYCRNHLCANSARDFIASQEAIYIHGSCNSSKLLLATIILVLVILLLIAFTLYRERVRITVRFGLWRAKGRPILSHKFSNQNTPSTSRLNTPRHSVTALHGVHAVGSPLQRLKASERTHASNSPGTPKRTPMIPRTPPPTRLPPAVPQPHSRNM